MKKRLLVLLMALAMCFAMFGCGSDEPATDATTEEPAVTTEEPAPADEEAPADAPADEEAPAAEETPAE